MAADDAGSATAPCEGGGAGVRQQCGSADLFHPLLTLGLPSNAVMALMMGAMMIQGIAPGSAVMTKHADLFWGMVASMWIGNAMLLGDQSAADRNVGKILLDAVPAALSRRILLFCVIGACTAPNTNVAQLVID